MAVSRRAPHAPADDEALPDEDSGFQPFGPRRRPRTREPEQRPPVATVVEMVGKWVRIRYDADAHGHCADARLRVRAEVVAGDRVWVEREGSFDVVAGHAPRRTELRRSGNSGVRVVCANADVLAIVSAAQDPPFRAGLVDRMLVAASAAGMKAAIVLNKCDMGMEEEVLERLAWYEHLGTPVYLLSALQGRNLEEFRASLAGRTTVLAGHSGVGKSSLLRALVPGVDRPAGALDDWGRGKHTTTGACAFDVPTGGVLVDLPGVREYGVGFVLREELRTHFPELRDLPCAYADCAHDGEDGCVADEVCDAQRIESYRKLLEECA